MMSLRTTGTVGSTPSRATERVEAGRLEAIWVAPRAGDTMEARTSVQVEPGVGVCGDRYATGRGHWSGQGDCEVTLIEGETLDQLAAFGVQLPAGAHRRNLVTRGVRLADLSGQRFTIGSAEFVFDRIRPPCRYLESVTRVPGVRNALGGVRAGVCARVTAPGRVEVGDRVTVVRSTPRGA